MFAHIVALLSLLSALASPSFAIDRTLHGTESAPAGASCPQSPQERGAPHSLPCSHCALCALQAPFDPLGPFPGAAVLPEPRVAPARLRPARDGLCVALARIAGAWLSGAPPPFA
jgi:hypothetical protein